MPEKVAVVVPFHKSTLTANEAFALSQIVKTLKSYPLLFALPAGIDPSFVKDSGGQTIYFPVTHFQSILNYDRLFCSLEFYETFSSYSHILVAQLDSIVFSDQLAYWCQQPYDFIGAPWVFNLAREHPYARGFMSPWHRSQKFLRLRSIFGRDYQVGNGGFSLRKVRTFIRVLTDYREEVTRFRLWAEKLWQQGYKTATNEDFFWSILVPTFYKQFRIPAFKVAAGFSFECNPAYCFKRNNRQLPFACHAWEKHGPDFWLPFLKQLGYQVKNDESN
jgi:hypothetical protein